jgi:hypothetical protein
MRDNSAASYITTYYGSPVYPTIESLLPDGTGIPCAKAGGTDYVFVANTEASCPEPFVVFDRDGSDDKSPDESNCAIPCPSFLFSPEERDIMWSSHGMMGIFGFILNVAMLVQSILDRILRRKSKKLPPPVWGACYAGLLYGLLHVIPSLVLKENLPCSDCVDEWCHGSSTPCRLAAASSYLLLAVVFMVAHMLFDLLHKCWFTKRQVREQHTNIFDATCGAYCFLLAILCLAADSLPTDEETDEFHRLSAARDSFACNPKYNTYTQEMLMYTLPFVIATGTLLVCLAGVVKCIMKAQNKVSFKEGKKDKKRAKIPTKLLVLGLILILLLFCQLAVLAIQAPVLFSYNEEAKDWQFCVEKNFAAGDILSQMGESEECGGLPTTTPSVEASIFQGLIQNSISCLVGVFWGIPRFYASAGVAMGLKQAAATSTAESSGHESGQQSPVAQG